MLTIQHISKPSYFSFCLLLLVLLPFAAAVQAQDSGDRLNEALKLYEEGDYEEAALMFEQIEGDQADLFAGKSYFGSGRFIKARQFLSKLYPASDYYKNYSTGKDSNAVKELVYDAGYTLALCRFQLKNWSGSLELLYDLKQIKAPRYSDIRNNARAFYDKLASYLTVEQRLQAFRNTGNLNVVLDLIASSYYYVDHSTASILLDVLKQSWPELEMNSQIRELEKELADTAGYRGKRVQNPKYAEAPDGIAYNLGVALPEIDPDTREFAVSQQIYYGALKAVEEFNEQNEDKKVFIKYSNTFNKASGSNQASSTMNRLIWKDQVDAVLGPLFSESAQHMKDLAEKYQIPLVAPMANSDSLNMDNPYVWQANPTFAVRGRIMAEYAVKELKYDSLAVIAEANSLGSAAAYAFRTEVERLGGEVIYSFVEPLEEEGYDLAPYTEHFTGDKKLRDSLNYKKVDAVYAPFTGQVAPTLIDLFLTDLEASKSKVKLLGSQEWGNVDLDEDRIEKFTIHYTQAHHVDTSRTGVSRFKKEFNKQFGLEADRFAFIGYDIAKFLVNSLEQAENPANLKEVIKGRDPYKGYSKTIHFDNTHINQRMSIFKITKEGNREVSR